jgi:hypothetical protein
MSSLLVIRLHPIEPVEGAVFSAYLDGLAITAHEISYANPSGADPAFAPLGSATYIAPALPPSPDNVPPIPVQDPATRIVQHFSIDPVGLGWQRVFAATATAVIVIPDPPAGGEYHSADIRITLNRAGSELIHKPLYYNVVLAPAPLPADPNDYQALAQVSFHLPLPSTAQGGGVSSLLADDGTAPNFDALRTAVEGVLNMEPGNLAGIAGLSRARCRHIAYEIVWDRVAFPLPLPKRSFEDLYTGPQAADSDDERDRLIFEGELLTYYTRHNTEAEHLANFVFSLSAALWCEQRSEQAAGAGYSFPPLPGTAARAATVVLRAVGGGALVPAFSVPACYFYALAAILPPQVSAAQRFSMAILQAPAQTVQSIDAALEDDVLNEAPAVNRFQAARRLEALGLSGGAGVAECDVAPGSDLQALITAWLNFAGDDIGAFWAIPFTPSRQAGHLELVLCALTMSYAPLVAAIKAAPFSVSDAAQLAAKTQDQWNQLLLPAVAPVPELLPPFTRPGTAEERAQAFLRRLRRFFDIADVDNIAPLAVPGAAPVLDLAAGNLIDELLSSYPGGFDFNAWDDATLQTTLDAMLPGDAEMQAQVTDWLRCVRAMLDLTVGVGAGVADSLRFSVMEGLWARGITSAAIVDRYTSTQLREVLAGSIAWEFADVIWNNAQADGPAPGGAIGPFQPINLDGAVINCVPPPHRSPLGPLAYLQALLRASAASTCDAPVADGKQMPLAGLLAERRGPLGELAATRANLEVPLPLIDLVNESLEHMAASGDTFGAVFNTARDTLGGHLLNTSNAPGAAERRHDPLTLFEAMPEHSTPAVPTASQPAWDVLAKDFSTCRLPYSQWLDVSRSYLKQLGSSRYATMRRFRRDITELVLDPHDEPADFERHLWRYPVRLETALEYLGVSPEEYATLYAGAPFVSAQVRGWYGYAAMPQRNAQDAWQNEVLRLDNFLARTCLTYCEFIELWRTQVVDFAAGIGQRGRDRVDFPDCPPCCLEQTWIRLPKGASPLVALGQLFVFIRLWRTLQGLGTARYSIAQLRDIAEVLQLFIGAKVNPEFIRQLASFQILRDEFQLALSDGSAPAPGASGAARSHLLALWAPADAHGSWAVQHLLDQIQQYAQRVHGCGCRAPEFLKLLNDNLDMLSLLAGFTPGVAADSWRAHPTHSLRFAEVLAKIYASDFGVGELLLLFTVEPHLQGDDAFALQTNNEAKDLSFSLPDDEDEVSLLALRNKLRAVEIDPAAAEAWSWARIDATLRREFGYQPGAGPGAQPLRELGQHFFPGQLGVAAGAAESRYSAPLPAGSSEPMWNTPADGPFHYDPAAKSLSAQLPLVDAAIIAKLARIRPLSAAEQQAVRDLYYLPRRDLAHFSYLFDSFSEAEQRLIQDPDEASRWAWFQQQFELFYQRCHLIAEHLARHVAYATNRPCGRYSADSAALLLKHLRADDNHKGAAWEADSGQAPAPRWDAPNGGAYAALLGLRGTGILAEFYNASGQLVWRDLSDRLGGFGEAGNASNAPLPTLIPDLALTLSAEQLRSVGIRNGFALANADGGAIGGAEAFRVVWRGLVMLDCEGDYAFAAGTPLAGDGLPDFGCAAAAHRWRVLLRRGQKSWVLLAHNWPGETAPGHCADAISLKRGFYEIDIELERHSLHFDDPEDRCAQITGWQLKYKGPDSAGQWDTIPHHKLYQSQQQPDLRTALATTGAAAEMLDVRYTSSVRDIRRTYARAFKAQLLVERFDLSARPLADDGQSELGYLLSQPQRFAGHAYYRNGGMHTHAALFDFNFLPVLDNYRTPAAAEDQRAAPSARRMQAMFDWWERLFDHTRMRHGAGRAPESPAWLLWHEAAELHTDNPAHLLRHLGVDLRHAPLLLTVFDPASPTLAYELSSDDLADDRWTVRVWHAERWVRALLQRFLPQHLPFAQPWLWASDGPALDGNANLTRFYRDGCIENSAPRRYLDIKILNDGLRVRGRDALLAYLTHMNRVPLPGGGYASNAQQLAELLLIDVQAGTCQKASRVEEAVSALQQYVQRARLGLEPDFTVTPAFILVWERRFAAFRVWEACTRRSVYRENWIEWDELHLAQGSEAFQFLQLELQRATLTAPVPGGLAYWDGPRAPAHPGLELLQRRQPALIDVLLPGIEGLGLLGTPGHSGRRSWLAPLPGARQRPPGRDPRRSSDDNPAPAPDSTLAALPLWLQAAQRLGRRFVRVAAAGLPPASMVLDGHCDDPAPGPCCAAVGALVDEYYFWIEDSRVFEAQPQDASWGASADDPQSGWHRPEQLPTLLAWPSQATVHLHWSRLHNGEFDPPRRSALGVRVSAGAVAELEFNGRSADSLAFAVTHGVAPAGMATLPAPGFRYDIATDSAIVVPEASSAVLATPAGELAALPLFALFNPGAPLLPVSPFAVAVAVAGNLRAHCRYEAALKWYELAYAPLAADNRWIDYGDQGEERNDDRGAELDAGCCASIPVALTEQRERAILLHYLETLLQWSETLMRLNTPEAFQKARLLIDTAARITSALPATVLSEVDDAEAPTVLQMQLACAPLNPRLLCIYAAIAERSALIHNCLNAARRHHGRPTQDMPYFGESPLRGCWQTAQDPCADMAEWCVPKSCYRFSVLLQKAQELASELRSLSALLLSAFEKGDAEGLAALRSTHETQLLTLSLEVRQSQWREADWQVQALQKAKQMAQTRLHYYRDLVANGLISGEMQYEPLTISASSVRTAGNVSVAIGQVMNLIPDPFVGFPVNGVTLPPGSKLSGIFGAAGTIANTVAEILNAAAALGLTKSGWERREDEWQHQIDLITVEIEQIERQILAAERQRDASLRELNNQQRMIANAGEVQDYLRDKFTSQARYLWLQQEAAASCVRMYQLALPAALQAQAAFNYERGFTVRRFIDPQNWDNLHEGLMAGERLMLSLRQMEKAYFDENCRDYELTKHLSLRLLFPLEFLRLRLTGSCEIDVPEWLFDMDYPGHYMRRLKNVSLSIPCVTGPYTGVHCKLTLISSTTRIDSRLHAAESGCCERPHDGPYALRNEDMRAVRQYLATEAIATSTGQQDGGMFELNFRDERYLPFEFAGAISRWRIELPKENNFFDMDSLANLVMHMSYIAREGGDLLRQAAATAARARLPGDGRRMFDMKRELPEAWTLFDPPGEHHAGAAARIIRLKLSRNMFPFLPGRRPVQIHRLGLLIEAEGATPSAHRTVRFVANLGHQYRAQQWDDCDSRDIECVASADWPCLYHGELDVTLHTLCSDEGEEVGALIFPADCGPITKAFLFCDYTADLPALCDAGPAHGRHH